MLFHPQRELTHCGVETSPNFFHPPRSQIQSPIVRDFFDVVYPSRSDFYRTLHVSVTSFWLSPTPSFFTASHNMPCPAPFELDSYISYIRCGCKEMNSLDLGFKSYLLMVDSFIHSKPTCVGITVLLFWTQNGIALMWYEMKGEGCQCNNSRVFEQYSSL